MPSVNRTLFNGAIAGSQNINLRIAATKGTSFQFTHPGSGTVVFQISNSTDPVNIVNDPQMNTIGWSDFQIILPDGTKTYIVDFSDPVVGPSPTNIPLKCLNFEYLRIIVSGTGDYRVDQHINDLNYTHED